MPMGSGPVGDCGTGASRSSCGGKSGTENVGDKLSVESKGNGTRGGERTCMGTGRGECDSRVDIVPSLVRRVALRAAEWTGDWTGECTGEWMNANGSKVSCEPSAPSVLSSGLAASARACATEFHVWDAMESSRTSSHAFRHTGPSSQYETGTRTYLSRRVRLPRRDGFEVTDPCLPSEQRRIARSELPLEDSIASLAHL